MKWFKIGDDNFTAKDASIQFTIDSVNNIYGYSKIISNGPQIIDITISVENNQNNSNYFFNLFDKSKQPDNSANYKFDIQSSDFIAYGCIIKSITSDPTTSLITMDIRSEYSSVRSLQERRDDIIDEILKTSKK